MVYTRTPENGRASKSSKHMPLRGEELVWTTSSAFWKGRPHSGSSAEVPLFVLRALPFTAAVHSCGRDPMPMVWHVLGGMFPNPALPLNVACILLMRLSCNSHTMSRAELTI